MKKLKTTIATLCAAGRWLPIMPVKARKRPASGGHSKLDPNGHLYAYMNTAKAMKQFDQMIESAGNEPKAEKTRSSTTRCSGR